MRIVFHQRVVFGTPPQEGCASSVVGDSYHRRCRRSSRSVRMNVAPAIQGLILLEASEYICWSSIVGTSSAANRCSCCNSSLRTLLFSSEPMLKPLSSPYSGASAKTVLCLYLPISRRLENKRLCYNSMYEASTVSLYSQLC